MAKPKYIEPALTAADSFDSFFHGLLHGALGWPIPEEALKPFDVGYEWSSNELDSERTRHKARAFELMLLPREQQPHGIFLLEFHDKQVFDTRGFATPLRAVLRRLVASQRKHARLPSWKLDNILFICTHDYSQFVFAMFRDTFGTGKVSEARLASFGWSRGEPCRTVVEHNLPKLEWPEDTEDREAWVKGWAEAFNKEPLTDRFFKHFDEALKAVKADLVKHGKLPSAQAYSKAQLLLERLLFLYFVQNRGWLDQDCDYLRRGFEPFRAKPDDLSYYEEFLEPLFWSLSSPGHSSFKRNEAIPFLNGGLFNDDEFEPSPRRRTDNPPLKVRNATFARVFDEFLDAYNFTVREDTPLNQEVAVDPEMLGKVFESIVLQAESADPDATAPDKRKQTGSYYTPRIVVHFICREVLFQYLNPRLEGKNWDSRLRQVLELDASDGLDEDERERLKGLLSPEEGQQVYEIVKGLRCCDPAVGSGAFMVGLLHELTNLRRVALAAAGGYVDPARKEGSGWLHETKADIIENCLFGVDIQQQAIEICMLRLWLSIVVDYDLGVDPFEADRKQFLEAIKDISQLPNLEMNFKRGDSLHDRICGVPIVIQQGRSHQWQKWYDEIHRLGLRLHRARSSKQKRKLRLQIVEKRLDLSEQVIAAELKLLRQEDSTIAGMFGESKSEAEQRRRIKQEAKRHDEAARRLAESRKELERLAAKPLDPGFQQRLRKLEGADFDSPFNFAWRIDFPQVFYPEQAKTTLNGKLALGNDTKGQMDLPSESSRSGGFDIIVGNPPFVTARNKERRELWRERWQPYCYKEWHMLVPFFPLATGLLRGDGQLGYIVSNAFGTRAFGRPFVEQFFLTVNIQKVVDCSGFMFPGHGTPTCLVFLGATRPSDRGPVRVTAIKPGGGALKLVPEDSPLWHDIRAHHDEDFANDRLVVHALARRELSTHPWGFLQSNHADDDSAKLADFCTEPAGAQFITGKDEAFVLRLDHARRAGLPCRALKGYASGEDVRDWTATPSNAIVFPYTNGLEPLAEPLPATLDRHLRPYKRALENCVVSSSIRKKETSLRWFEYRRLARAKWLVPWNIVGPHIATHAHYAVTDHAVAYKEKAVAIALERRIKHDQTMALVSTLNSSYALLWLKQQCFSKRESERPERDTYYEFAGGKVEQLPVPEGVAQALRGEWNPLARRLATLAQACGARGQTLLQLTAKELFGKLGEAYHEWNSLLPGYDTSHEAIGRPFSDAASLRLAYDRVVAEREKLRTEMIALQEEMDWLVYAAYGLLPEDHPAVVMPGDPAPLDKDLRPFVLWKRAEGDYAAAAKLIPCDWPEPRRKLWRERLAVTRDNEHIRRIEQPVYKRRWDEQWKVGGKWKCGDEAYRRELRDAFEWWLLEKAEWYLENKKDGGPVELCDWAAGLWKDSRVRAAVEFVAAPSANPEGFERLLKELVDRESVEDGIPFAKPWDELARKKLKGLTHARSIRGKLNVPRERFHKTSRTSYKWAGLQFR